MTTDEIQAAITMAEAKRSELTAAPVIPDTARVLSLLPKAAAAYRSMIAQGVSKHPEAAARARAAVRQLVGGRFSYTQRRPRTVRGTWWPGSGYTKSHCFQGNLRA